MRPTPRSTLFPYTTLFRSFVQDYFAHHLPSIQFSSHRVHRTANVQHLYSEGSCPLSPTQNHLDLVQLLHPDRKSTRLNSSHSQISYAVFCLKKKHEYCTLI